MWAEDDLELLAVLSLLQNAGITGVLHRAGTVKRAEFKKIQRRNFLFTLFVCVSLPVSFPFFNHTLSVSKLSSRAVSSFQGDLLTFVSISLSSHLPTYIFSFAL